MEREGAAGVEAVEEEFGDVREEGGGVFEGAGWVEV
jgi:hypothetical protein